MPIYPLPPVSRVISLEVSIEPGSNFSITVPDNFIYLPIAASFQLDSSSNIVNRFPGIIITDPDSTLVASHIQVAHVAETVIKYYFYIGCNQSAITVDDNLAFLSMPDLFYMSPGWKFESHITNMHGDDVITNVVVTFLSWTAPQST